MKEGKIQKFILTKRFSGIQTTNGVQTARTYCSDGQYVLVIKV